MTISSYEVQTFLRGRGFYKGNIDGIFGRQSMAAALSCINDAINSRKHVVAPLLPNRPERHRLGVEQIMMASMEPKLYADTIDGLMGPNTRYGYTLWDAGKWRDPLMEELPGDEERLATIKNVWPVQKDMLKFYGPMGANLARIKPPYPMKIAWDLSQSVTTIAIHEKVADSAMRVLTRVLDHYGLPKILALGLDLFGGCLASPPRAMRGGSAPSTHNWGIAIDFDPEHNQLKWNHSRARAAGPEYAQFWKLWEEEGWLSLGRARDFDWMHIQAARL